MFYQILKLFSPNLAPTDSLSGGEFFAVLRLVVHAEKGKEVDRSLAFVQGMCDLSDICGHIIDTFVYSPDRPVFESR